MNNKDCQKNKKSLLLFACDLASGRRFSLGIIAAALLGFVLNVNSLAMHGIHEYYNDYFRVFSGLLHLPRNQFPTFPMWGYALVLPPLGKGGVVFLQLFVYLSLCLFLWRFSAFPSIRPLVNRKLFLSLVAFPSFSALYATLTPYPLAITFQTFSICLFILGTQYFDSTKSFRLGIGDRSRALLCFSLSGLTAGATLNFRSEFLYFFIFVPIIYAIYRLLLFEPIAPSTFKTIAMRLAVFAFAFYFMLYASLVPWSNYTKSVTGTKLYTSTNSGHVFFIGLGQLPGNPWGITPSDGDPVMSNLLQANNIESSLSFHGDNLLKDSFRQRIVSEPFGYLARVSFGFLRVAFGGIYIPEFFESVDCNFLASGGSPKDSCRELIKKFRFDSSALRLIVAHPVRIFLLALLLVASLVVFLLSSVLVALSIFTLPFFVKSSLDSKSFACFLFSLAIVYQCLIGSFAFHMPLYMSNVFPLVAFQLSWLFRSPGSWRPLAL